jgi:hypothetical protein
MAAIVVPLLLLALEIVLIADFESWSFQHIPFEYEMLAISLLFLLRSPELWYHVAIAVIPAVMVAVATYGLRTRGRHGYAFTSYGVVRVRGQKLRLLRYGDMVGLETAERNYPQHRVITDELELKAADGKSLVLYGFGLGRWRQIIEARMRGLGSGDSVLRTPSADAASPVRPTVPEE